MKESLEESPELRAEIVELIAQNGPISFAKYMELCLYHEPYGYYTSVRNRIGKQGDFFTSSSVHSLFGRLISRQIAQLWQIMGEGPFTLVEQGAGEGYLCLDILDALAEEAPELYQQLEYRILELSSDHRARQGERLSAHVTAGRIKWHESSDLESFTGCFLSNELVDAFPVHVVEKRDNKLLEVMVNYVDGSFVEEFGPLTDSRIQDYFELSQHPLVEGNRAEVNVASIDWIDKVSSSLEKGAIITIDYGYPAAELLAPWRRAGTLLCYHRHQSSDNPYQHIGCQDITAHVNFSLLEKIAGENGFETLYFGEQYRFLMGLGFVEELIRLQALETDPIRAQALRMTLKNLILPEGGMGESFKVLLQGKGLGSSALLCARTIREIGLTSMM